MCTAAMKIIYSILIWIPLLLSSFTCQPVKGKNRLIGSKDPIIVTPGEDVILPCRLELEMDLLEQTIEWSKEGGEMEAAKRQLWNIYVFLYRRGIKITSMMMKSYMKRTSVFDDRLRHGDMSLKITNVTLNDNGTYECALPKSQERAKVQLIVSPDFPTSTTKKPLSLISPTSIYGGEGNSQKNGQSIVPVLVLLGFFLVFFFLLFFYHVTENQSDCSPAHPENIIADDTTVVGPKTEENKKAYDWG